MMLPFFRKKPDEQESERHVTERTRQCAAQFVQLTRCIDWQYVTDGRTFCMAVAALLGNEVTIETKQLSSDVQGTLLIQGRKARVVYTSSAPQVLVEHILCHEGVHLWLVASQRDQGVGDTLGEVDSYFEALDTDFVNTSLLYEHKTGEQSEEELRIDLLADFVAQHIETVHVDTPPSLPSIAFNDFMNELRRS